MTASDERYFAEQRAADRARGRCVAALGLGVVAPLVALPVVVTAPGAVGLAAVGVAGLLGAGSVWLVVAARGVSAWSRLACGLPGALTALVAGLIVLLVWVDTL